MNRRNFLRSLAALPLLWAIPDAAKPVKAKWRFTFKSADVLYGTYYHYEPPPLGQRAMKGVGVRFQCRR